MSMEEPIKYPPSSTDHFTKKRPRENDSVFNNSKQFKLRAILRDLRPSFLEVLRTDDFRNCKAADEIREQMKIMVEICNHNLPSEKPLAEDSKVKGTYIIGGSAFGWNFVTFSGKDPVYSGVTKETFRVNNVAASGTTPPPSN